MYGKEKGISPIDGDSGGSQEMMSGDWLIGQRARINRINPIPASMPFASQNFIADVSKRERCEDRGEISAKSG